MKKILVLLFMLIACVSFGQTRPHWLQLQGKPFVMPTDAPFLAKGDGITDDSVALQAWLDYLVASGNLGFLPPKTFLSTAKLTTGGSVNIMGCGRNVSNIRFTGTTGTLEISTGDDPTPLPNISIDITPASNTITFVSAHGLTAGDVFTVMDSADYSWSPYRTYYRLGEMFEVESVVSTTEVLVSGNPAVTIPVGVNIVCYKMPSMRGVCLRNLGIEREGNTILGALKVRMAQGVLLDNIRVLGDSYFGVSLESCYAAHITNSDIRALGSVAGLNYGVIVSNGKGVVISNSFLHGTRAGFDFGGSDDLWDVLNMDMSITNSVLKTSLVAAGKGLGGHGNHTGLLVSNSTIYGAYLSGENTKIDHCLIKAHVSNKSLIHFTELSGARHSITNCTIESPDVGTDNVFGFYGIFGKNMRGGELVISNNTLVIPPTVREGSKLEFMDLIWNSTAASDTSIIIEGNSCIGNIGSLWSGITLRANNEAIYHALPQFDVIRIKDNIIKGGVQYVLSLKLRPPHHLDVSGNTLESYKLGYIQPIATALASETASSTINFCYNTFTYTPNAIASAPESLLVVGNMKGTHMNFVGNTFRNCRRSVIINDIGALHAFNNNIFFSPLGKLGVSAPYTFTDIGVLSGEYNMNDLELTPGSLDTNGTIASYGVAVPY